MIATLIILALSAVFFAMGKVRSDLVALCALVALLLTGTLSRPPSAPPAKLALR